MRWWRDWFGAAAFGALMGLLALVWWPASLALTAPMAVRGTAPCLERPLWVVAEPAAALGGVR